MKNKESKGGTRKMVRSCYLLTLCLIFILAANLFLEPCATDNKLVKADISNPTIIDSTDESRGRTNSILLGGEISNANGEDAIAHICGGDNDGGTDTASRDNSLDLKITDSGNVYADTNNITTTPLQFEGFQQLIGVDDIPPAWEYHNLRRFLLMSRYVADYSGTLTQIRLKVVTKGTARVAIYTDNNNYPGQLLSANNNNTWVDVKVWNSIDIPPVQITKGTVYWLAAMSDCKIARAFTNGPTRYRIQHPYSTATFQDTYPPGYFHLVVKKMTILIQGWGEMTPEEPSITYKVAYIPVKYADDPDAPDESKPMHTVAELKQRAEAVTDYYRQQSYGKANLSYKFIFDDWTYLPKTFEEYGSPEPGVADWLKWKEIKDDAIDLMNLAGINEYDYHAVVVIQPACIRSFDGRNIITSEKKSYASWAHEIGHAIFGFADYYDDTDPETDAYGNIQYWGLMGSATLMNPTAPIMSYNKVLAEWLIDEPLICKTEYKEHGPIKLLKDMNLGDRVYKYEANANTVKYYIFEGRQPPDEIAEDYLIPSSGYCPNDDYDYELNDARGVLLYRVTTYNWVYSVPHQHLPWFEWMDNNKVTLTPGKTYADDEAQVTFKAIEKNGQLHIDISANPRSNRQVFSLFNASWEITVFPVENEPTPSQWHFDLDLHAYTYDGREIGMDYTTGEYRVQVEDARTTFDTPGGGPEWISLPDDENVYYVIDPTPAREWANELGVEVKNIKATWQIVYYDEDGTRKESDPITFDISLDEPALLGLQASIDIEPDTLNLKSKGKWITCWIELPAGYDVNNIDLGTVMLNHAVPAESDTKYGFVKNPEIRDADEDGLPELMVKFDGAAVQATVQPADSVTVSVLGEVSKDEVPIPFKGTDTIKVISPGK